MKKPLIYISILSLLVGWESLSTQTAYAYPEDEPIFSIAFPDDWVVEADEQLLHATPPDESIYFGLWALEDSDEIDVALEAIEEIASEFVTDLESDEPEEMEINGIPFLIIDGQGEDEDGNTIHVSSALFIPDEETVILILYFGSPESEEKYEAQLVNIIQSIKRNQ